MTRDQAIALAASQATAKPMADVELIAGVIDILASLDIIRFSADLPRPSELVAHRRGAA